MKITFATLVASCALIISSHAAETITTLSDVHLCCQSCVKGVNAAVGKVPGVTATVDKSEGTVKLAGPDTATVQKAVNSLTTAGYFGKSSDPEIKVSSQTGAKGQKVQSMKVEGVHLCCGKCVTAVDNAIKSVPGVKSQNAVKNAESFEVTGDFNDKEVFTALQKAGLTGNVGK